MAKKVFEVITVCSARLLEDAVQVESILGKTYKIGLDQPGAKTIALSDCLKVFYDHEYKGEVVPVESFETVIVLPASQESIRFMAEEERVQAQQAGPKTDEDSAEPPKRRRGRAPKKS